MKGSIRTKIRWLILIPLCGVGIVAVSAFLFLSRIEITERTQSDVKTAAASLTSLLEERRSHLEAETKLLAEVPYIRAAVRDPAGHEIGILQDKSTAQDQVDNYSKFINNDGLILVNSDGSTAAASGPIREARETNVGRLGIGDGQDGKPWSGVVQTPQGLFLAATSPFFVAGYYKGAVVCYSEINSETAKALSKLMSTEVAFLENGKVVACSSNMPALSIASSGPTYAVIGGRKYVGLYAPFSDGFGRGAGFVAFRTVDEIVNPSKMFLVALLAILIPAILIAVLIANRFAGNVVGPLDGVVEAAAILERGDWPEQFKVGRSDEIGLLQTAFNRMTASVQEHQQKLLAMIDMDPLTELPNHRKFKEIMGIEIAHAHSRSVPLALIILDIDRFSHFNRSRGLIAGDEVLKGAASLLANCLPEGGHLSRYGGEEFAILLPGYSLDQAREFANEMRGAFEAEHVSHRITISGGCAEFAVGTDRPESLCLAAELALAKAKQLGRNQICNFESDGAENSNPFELNRFLQDGTLATIQALAAAVDAKDTYTKGHSQRVAEYAARLCRFVGGTSQEADLVFRTGTLHDVGKIGVPDNVLKKQGPLTAEERAVMETHPALGELIVKKVPQLADTLPGVRHHHERWDGKGYPDGIAGEKIPRLARILALADTFDAMTSDRPYRRGLPISVALDEISKNSGIQFDPDLAPAFVQMVAAESGIELDLAA